MFSKYIIIFLLFVTYSVQNADKHISPHNRIYHGDYSVSVPYQVALFINKGLNEIHFCGGSLITRSVVLTAAHCIHSALSIKVVLGVGTNQLFKDDMHRIELLTQLFKVHKLYDPVHAAHDISLVKLPREVHLSYKITLVNLPSGENLTIPYDDVDAKLTGWGATSDNNTQPTNYIKKLTVHIIDVPNCGPFHVRPFEICGIGRERGSACVGDSGSPLVLENRDGSVTQIGIVSFGSIHGCTLGFPIIYTRVAAYIDWIQANLNF